MAKYYYLPTAAAIAVASFVPVDQRHPQEPALALEYINYGIIAGLQITSLSDAPITIERVLINLEFLAVLHASREEGVGSFLRYGFPRRLSHFGDSFLLITAAPAAPDPVRELCYGKPVTEARISTKSGHLEFKIGDSFNDYWMIPYEERA